MDKSMNDIYNQVDNLFKDIKESDIYKNYILCVNKLKKNKEIMNLITEIKRLQKIDANNQDNFVKEEIEKNYKILNSYPIYQSYLINKDELNELLSEVSLVFNNYFSKVLKINI